MSIRTIIKASNAAQLLLLLLLGLCLIAFGRGLHNSKSTLENYYHLELLLVEVEANARQSYDEALAFILTGNPDKLPLFHLKFNAVKGQLFRMGIPVF